MGSRSFLNVGTHLNPDRAFWAEVAKALAAHGRDGYTGTIAEKYEFEIVIPPAQRDPLSFAMDLDAATFDSSVDRLAYFEDATLADAMRTYGDKWGPAVAIPGNQFGEWIFCGLASS